MQLSTDHVQRAAAGDLDVLQHELKRVDPDSVHDMDALHEALARVLGGASAFGDDVRVELAIAWLRGLTVSQCLPELAQRRVYGVAIIGLNDPNPLVGAALAESFAYVGTREHLPILLAIFRDRREERTVRVDSLESALANADDCRPILSDLLNDRDEPSAFVRWMLLLHGLFSDVSDGPTERDLDRAAAEDMRHWPPQETFARTLRRSLGSLTQRPTLTLVNARRRSSTG